MYYHIQLVVVNYLYLISPFSPIRGGCQLSGFACRSHAKTDAVRRIISDRRRSVAVERFMSLVQLFDCYESRNIDFRNSLDLFDLGDSWIYH